MMAVEKMKESGGRVTDKSRNIVLPEVVVSFRISTMSQIDLF